MSGSGNSLINLGDLAKPANTLIEKISDAIGGLSKPFQIRRVARAEADADRIRAITSIEVTKLEHRAMSRLFAEEAKKQQNIEAITLKALPDIGSESRPQDVEDDWITNFFDKCRLISDEEMQSLWARILAGEANSPGKFSKRTVNLLGSLDKSDATLFSELCSFVFEMMGEPNVLIYDVNNRIYNDAGINFTSATHLESIGLVTFSPPNGYVRDGMSQTGVIHYFDSPIWFKLPQITPAHDGFSRVPIGNVILSKAGEQLAPLSGAKPREGFLDFVLERWKSVGITAEKKAPESASGE